MSPALCLSLSTPLREENACASCLAELEKAFPLPENTAYLHELAGGLVSVTGERLSALSRLPSLLRRMGVDPTELVLSRDGHGRPYVTDRHGHRPVDFNLSHTRAHVLCAAVPAPYRVGVDVEEPISPARAEKLMERYATEGERAIMRGRTIFVGEALFPARADFRPDFTAIWTVREAIAKYEGTGHPLRFDASLPPRGSRLLLGHLADTGTRVALCLSGAIREPVETPPALILDLDLLIP